MSRDDLSRHVAISREGRTVTTEETASSTRKSAIVVGVLYIFATVAGVLTLAPLGPCWRAQAYSPMRLQMKIG